MKVTRFLLSALFLGAMATAASAQGVVDVTWDGCSSPVINKDIAPGTTASLYASLFNHSAPHNGYEVQVVFGSGNAGPLRDAWRFDAAGCQGTAFITIDHLAPAAVVKVCPSFSENQSVLQIKRYEYDPLTGKATGLVANAYPAGAPTNNPAQRYFLARWLFDHTFSVDGPSTPGQTCGGLAVGVCAHLRVAKYNAIGGGEINWAFGREYATARDPNNATGCPGATPATSATWGSIKAQYKR